jgi:cytochrome c oxidase subunit 2
MTDQTVRPRTAGRLALAAAVAASLLVAAAPLSAPAEEPQVVEITAQRFEFSPKEITLEAGKPALLRLTSRDVTHGFYMKKLGIDAIVPAGKVTEVAVAPAAPGRYVVICDHFCGAGHGGMKMTIVVR